MNREQLLEDALRDLYTTMVNEDALYFIRQAGGLGRFEGLLAGVSDPVAPLVDLPQGLGVFRVWHDTYGTVIVTAESYSAVGRMGSWATDPAGTKIKLLGRALPDAKPNDIIEVLF